MKQALWALVVAAPLSALAQGPVDWQRQVLQVTGHGPPDVKASNPAQARLGAERSAREDAVRNLLEQAKGLPLSAERTVGQALEREETRRQVETVLRGYTVLHRRYYSDGGMQLDVTVPLGALTSVLVAPEPAAPPATGVKAETRYTGLVVDARKLDMFPVLAPRVLDAKGQRFYSAASLSSEAWKSTGVAAFFKSLPEARKAAGEAPLVLEAASLQGSDLKLGAEADPALAQLAPGLLAQGRVTIVVK